MFLDVSHNCLRLNYNFGFYIVDLYNEKFDYTSELTNKLFSFFPLLGYNITLSSIYFYYTSLVHDQPTVETHSVTKTGRKRQGICIRQKEIIVIIQYVHEPEVLNGHYVIITIDACARSLFYYPVPESSGCSVRQLNRSKSSNR